MLQMLSHFLRISIWLGDSYYLFQEKELQTTCDWFIYNQSLLETDFKKTR